MRILAIDTATSRGAVALVRIDDAGRTDLLAEAAATVASRHGETLLTLVEEVRAIAGVRPGDIDLVAVGVGPGSFTGLRVGLSTAKGLSLALGVPIVGVSTLAVVARAVPVDDVVVVLDAKRTEVFLARFCRGVEAFEPITGPHDVVARSVLALLGDARPLAVGAGARDPRFQSVLQLPLADVEHDAPSARVLAALAHEELGATGPSDLATLAPRYVRGADVTLP
jgi:tRNA threonylcarbamoyladenosine biosynthesis protein TsaB